MSRINNHKKASIYDLSIYLLVLLFPILPTYTVVFGRIIYDFVAILSFLLMCIGTRKVLKIKVPRVILISLACYAVAYLLHGEVGSLITIIVRFFLPIYMIAVYARDEEKVESIINLLLIVGVLLSLEAVFEFATEQNFFSLMQNTLFDRTEGAMLSYRYGRARAEGPFGTCLSFALYLFFINGLSIIQLRKANNKDIPRRSLYYISYVASIVGIYLSTARFTLFVILILNVFFFLKMRPGKKLLILLFGLVAAVLIGMDSESGLLDSVYAVLGIFNSRFLNNVSDGGSTYLYRIRLISLLSGYIKQHPIIGMGAAGKANLTFVVNENWTNAYSVDNNYLSHLIEYGVIGLIANVLPLVYMIATTVKEKQSSNSKVRIFSYWTFIMMILYAISLINVYQMGERRIFCILIGLMIAMLRNEKNKRTAIDAKQAI